MSEEITMEAIMKEIRKLHRIVKKIEKNTRPPEDDERKRKRPASGFLRPTAISPELAAFLGVPEDEKVCRGDVSSAITAHVRANGLQDPNDGRKIHADAKMETILRGKPDDVQLSYLNLQKYIAWNFLKDKK